MKGSFWEELYLYLVVSVTTVSVMLVWLGPNSKRRLVYFVRKSLSKVETGYIDFEPMALAIRMAAKKLRLYFLAHTIIILTGSPIRAILHKPNASGRLLKWAIELSEFDIEYRPKSAIKGQVLAHFIVER